MSIPNRRDSAGLLLSLDPPPWHLRHSRAVAETAAWLAWRAVAAGRSLDRRLVEAAALLHDVDKLPAVKVGQTSLQIGVPPDGPSVQFLPTPGAAQQAQISGQVQAAEVIGSALLYPNQSSDGELKMVEDCLAIGVSG